MIDQKQLRALSGGVPEVIIEILEDFHAEAIETLAQLEEGCLESRFKEAAGLLHSLAGSSGTLGLLRFCEEVRSWEGQCQQEILPKDTVPVLRNLLEDSVKQARAFLENGCLEAE